MNKEKYGKRLLASSDKVLAWVVLWTARRLIC